MATFSFSNAYEVNKATTPVGNEDPIRSSPRLQRKKCEIVLWMHMNSQESAGIGKATGYILVRPNS